MIDLYLSAYYYPFSWSSAGQRHCFAHPVPLCPGTHSGCDAIPDLTPQRTPET